MNIDAPENESGGSAVPDSPAVNLAQDTMPAAPSSTQSIPASGALPSTTVRADSWRTLRQTGGARIALGRAGASLPTAALLAFDLAHAQARDAVHVPLDVEALMSRLREDDWSVQSVRSRAAERSAYLARPDWGRRLALDDAARLRAASASTSTRPGAGTATDTDTDTDTDTTDSAGTATGVDIAIMIGDGLSSTAVDAHAPALLHALRPLLVGFTLAPLVIAQQARVALADEVAELCRAQLAICIIGERPGLSAADSLGAYLTYAPKVGRNDGERNCISNIRPGGLSLDQAAHQIAALARAALSRRVSGVALRFDPTRDAIAEARPAPS